MSINDLYRRVIMDHSQKPRNRGTLDADSITVELDNPSCGDKISLQLLIENGTIVDAKFMGEGCSISLSSASMMTEVVKGLSAEDALNLIDLFSNMMQGKDTDVERFGLEDIEALSGVAKFPARIKCATLAWKALEKGIKSQ